jgi:predicted dehydrogenase
MIGSVQPEVVAIASPPEAHYDACCAALEAGCHVFCEKPFMESLEEADSAIELARSVGKWIVVNNEFRFMNSQRVAKELIGSDEFGELLFLSAQQTFVVSEHTEAGWRGKSTRRTCKDFGPHVLDLCRFFYGEEPLSLTARMPKPGQAHGPDFLNLIQLEFSNDRVAHITLDRLSRGRDRYLDIRLDGSLATIETSIGGRASFTVGIAGGTRRPFARLDFVPGASATLVKSGKERRLATDPLDLFGSSTASLLDEFMRALDAGAEPPCHAADNRNTLALSLAAYDSAESGQPVDLKTYLA